MSLVYRLWYTWDFSLAFTVISELSAVKMNILASNISNKKIQFYEFVQFYEALASFKLKFN